MGKCIPWLIFWMGQIGKGGKHALEHLEVDESLKTQKETNPKVD